jgi:hypothetical protein
LLHKSVFCPSNVNKEVYAQAIGWTQVIYNSNEFTGFTLKRVKSLNSIYKWRNEFVSLCINVFD